MAESKKANGNIHIEYVDIRSLRHAEYNPRFWPKSSTEKLTKSIKKFGLIDPLIVNRANSIE